MTQAITILLVDDDASLRLVLREYLLAEGFRVLEASDGEEALRVIRDREPDQQTDSRIDLLITDLEMPRVDGQRLIAEVRRLCRHIKILVLSGSGSGNDNPKARAKGLSADAFLPKPCTPEQLLNAVRNLIGMSITEIGNTIFSQAHAAELRQNVDPMQELKLKHVLKKLISERKITLRELSKETGVPQSTISSFLAGCSTSKPEHVLAIAKHFGVSMEMLLFGKDDRPPTLDETLTHGIFEGWLKVKIEKAVPGKRNFSDDTEKN